MLMIEFPIGVRRLLTPLIYASVIACVQPALAEELQTVASPVAVAKGAMHCSACQCKITSGTMCEACAAVHGAPASAKMMKMMMPSTGNVYTLNNDPTNNGLAVYQRNIDGSLSPVAGSPFALHGRGLSGGDIDEQGAVRIHNGFVLAVNPGSDSIAVLKRETGGLMHVPGSPFPSGGSTPLSLTVHDNLVYVANQAAPFASPSSQPNITGFRLTAEGRLIPLSNSTVTFPKGQGPAQVEFSPQGNTLVVTAGFQGDDTSRVYSFKVSEEGMLKMGAGSPAKPQGATGTVGFSWNTSGDRIYASLFKGSAVVSFSVDPETAAIKQLIKPVGDDQQAACWTTVSRDGRTLYVGNFVSNSISVYDIATNGTPTLLGSIPRRGASVKDTKDIEISADGKYLYAIGSGAKQISVFRIESNRLLTELPAGRSPMVVASGQNITGLAVD